MSNFKIKKNIFVFVFFTLCGFSFAQNIRIIGNIPKTGTDKLYQLQIGAYRLAANEKKAAGVLTKNGFAPQYEKRGNLVRVFVVVKANEVRSAIDRLDKAGFKEVIIREYSAPVTPAEPRPVKPEPEKPVLPVEEEIYFFIEDESDYHDEWVDLPVFEIVEPELMHLYTEN